MGRRIQSRGHREPSAAEPQPKKRSKESGVSADAQESGADLRRESRIHKIEPSMPYLAVFFCAFCAFLRLKFRRPNARALAASVSELCALCVPCLGWFTYEIFGLSHLPP